MIIIQDDQEVFMRNKLLFLKVQKSANISFQTKLIFDKKSNFGEFLKYINCMYFQFQKLQKSMYLQHQELNKWRVFALSETIKIACIFIARNC
jgi:hypothetical protein